MSAYQVPLPAFVPFNHWISDWCPGNHHVGKVTPVTFCTPVAVTRCVVALVATVVDCGELKLQTGGGENRPWLVPVAALVVTLIVPSWAPFGTVAVSCMAVAAVTVAATPPNVTALFAGVVLKFVPEIVTLVPGAPKVGVKPVTLGVGPCRTQGAGAQNWFVY